MSKHSNRKYAYKKYLLSYHNFLIGRYSSGVSIDIEIYVARWRAILTHLNTIIILLSYNTHISHLFTKTLDHKHLAYFLVTYSRPTHLHLIPSRLFLGCPVILPHRLPSMYFLFLSSSLSSYFILSRYRGLRPFQTIF